MAVEVSRTFDTEHGAIFLKVKDRFGHLSSHTIYVLTVGDVEAVIQGILADTESQKDAIAEKFAKLGWVSGS